MRFMGPGTGSWYQILLPIFTPSALGRSRTVVAEGLMELQKRDEAHGSNDDLAKRKSISPASGLVKRRQEVTVLRNDTACGFDSAENF